MFTEVYDTQFLGIAYLRSVVGGDHSRSCALGYVSLEGFGFVSVSACAHGYVSLGGGSGIDRLNWISGL